MHLVILSQRRDCGGAKRTEDQLRCSVLRFTIAANGISSFFPLKIASAQRPAVPLPGHMHITFLRVEICVTREIDDLHQNFGFFLRGNGPRYSYQNLPHTPLGSPYNAIEILTLTPNNFDKLGKNFFGGGGPTAKGAEGCVCPKLKTASARGPPPYKIKLFLERWHNTLRHSGRSKKW